MALLGGRGSGSQIGGGSGGGGGFQTGRRSGGGHCATCTCNQRGDLMQKQLSPQGLVSTLKDLEKRVGKLQSAQRQGTRVGVLNTKARRKVPRDKRILLGSSSSGASTGGSGQISGSGGSGLQ